MTLEPGGQLGAYEIVEKIGAGGMGSVYKAYQTALGRFVAIKVLPPQTAGDPTFTERFAAEAKAIGKLRHPNIVTAFDFARQGDVAFLVSDFIDGGTLAEQLGAPLPLDYALGVLSQLGSALDYAHARGVVHRDVKPQNVLMTHDGVPVLTDFGLAKIVGPGSGLTQAGTLMGTAEYMAPECASGAEVAGPAADQYALALIAYEMLVGRHPFPADNPLSALMAHVNKPVPIPSQLGVALPPGVEAALLRGLAKRPEQRFARCGELVRALAGSMAPVPAAAAAAAVLPVGSEMVTPSAAAPADTRAPAILSPSALVRPPSEPPAAPVAQPATMAAEPRITIRPERPPAPGAPAPPAPGRIGRWRARRVLVAGGVLLFVLVLAGQLGRRTWVGGTSASGDRSAPLAAVTGTATHAPSPTRAPDRTASAVPSSAAPRPPTAQPVTAPATSAPPAAAPAPVVTPTPTATPAPKASDDYGNTAAAATPITASTAYSGIIDPRTDQDWFRFTVSGAVKLRAELSADVPGIAIALYTLKTGSASGLTQLEEAVDGGSGARVTYDAPGPGLYFLRISAVRNVTSPYVIGYTTR